MVGLLTEPGGSLKVRPQKNRDGRLLAPFRLQPAWDGDNFTLDYDGRFGEALSENGERVVAFVTGRFSATQADIINGAGLTRSTAQRAIREAVEAGRITDTGEKVNGSPIYSGAQSAVGTSSAESQ